MSLSSPSPDPSPSAVAADAPDAPVPLPSTVHVLPWLDPVVERHGHDPRSAYVEQFWLSVLGPTATWLLRRLVAGFDRAPDGYELDVAHTARALGLSVAKGTASPFAKAVQRCVMFGVASQRSDAWLVRRRVPAISQRHLLRLPADVQATHQEWTTTSVSLDELERAHVIAAAMLDAGDDPAMVETQLVAVGVPRRAAIEARELALRRAS